MRKIVVFVGLLLLVATAASAVPGQQWILSIDHLNGSGWTTLTGAGYNGTDAYSANTMDGVRRVYWAMNGAGMSATTELYTIEWFRPTTGAAGWQPIESQMRGVDGETFPIESQIPWVGAFGTNHQYIGAENGTAGSWVATGPGPHTPDSADYNAGANGTYMWLHSGSWLYAKWDYGWAIDHAWSAIRVTQVTGVVPEPTSLLALLAGMPALAILRRRR